ncbi:Rrf2 family transcriptional regulator [Lactobacillus sp. ESL0684]|uniref:Rrf2 family transcriptional regulator n=1 Tax=Lactobacillus sp. ESL0684 TaxID=2983213 RepID=UPI0023F64D71|nr:Rrf2 family transcriptional regulator [Lactobacillus sp. ESL0684]WEV43402.1 Rrf2 family transcriptional regulator [Lactobacillus sp. ESL0684]
MSNSIQLSDTIHIISYIAIYQDTDWVSSVKIAESVQTNPSNVRKIMGNLRRAGLITTSNGRSSPELTRLATKITLYDIYQATDHQYLFQIDAKTEPKCVVGGNIQTILTTEYQKLQIAVETEMKKIMLADILDKLAQSELKLDRGNQEIVKRFCK